MRAFLIVLLIVASARAEDKVDLVPRWRKGDVCDREISLTVRVRGKKKVGRVQRAITAEMTKTAEYRDKVLSATRHGVADGVERHYRRFNTSTVMTVAGQEPETKKETNGAQGSTQTLDAGRTRTFLVQELDRALNRKAVAVGDSWTFEDRGSTKTKLTCKLSQLLKFKGHRAAKIYTTLKAEGALGDAKTSVSVRGYVYFSLDAHRIIRTNLRGSMKTTKQPLGTVHGTISEVSTLVMVKAG